MEWNKNIKTALYYVSGMAFTPVSEISDPVHGYIYLSEVEREIVDT